MKKEIPILFSTPMVRSILEGRKTMTRRTTGLKAVNEKPDIWTPRVFDDIAPDRTDYGVYHYQNKAGDQRVGFDSTDEQVEFSDCPYGKRGDILWVRETWRKYCHVDEYGYTHSDKEIIEFAADNPPMIYQVDGDGFQEFNKDGSEKFIPWKPSIHMPKASARIWLEVTEVRIERLHNISEKDAIAEGVANGNIFRSLWQQLNGNWDDNPWVWVISFKVLSTTGKPILETTGHPEICEKL